MNDIDKFLKALTMFLNHNDCNFRIKRIADYYVRVGYDIGTFGSGSTFDISRQTGDIGNPFVIGIKTNIYKYLDEENK